MKKVFLTILAFFYLGVSSGATVDIHFCMGQLTNWGFSQSESEKCNNCGMEKGISPDCCKDKQHKLTVKESPKASSTVYQFHTLGLSIPLSVYNHPGIINSNLREISVLKDSPPPNQSIPAFIRNCTFRI
ncbi:MAG: hypothetical protein WBJ10_04185 [Daejeonella sp.]|uniref:HYC_CC_PP family protein n=1 Tax=Daejeonella sp. TaxID=2805397 RepID=UPI003C73DFDC